MMKDRVLEELQMITGVTCNDIDYLFALLILQTKENSNEDEVKEEKYVTNENSLQFKEIINFDEWFKGL